MAYLQIELEPELYATLIRESDRVGLDMIEFAKIAIKNRLGIMGRQNAPSSDAGNFGTDFANVNGELKVRNLQTEMRDRMKLAKKPDVTFKDDTDFLGHPDRISAEMEKREIRYQQAFDNMVNELPSTPRSDALLDLFTALKNLI